MKKILAINLLFIGSCISQVSVSQDVVLSAFVGMDALYDDQFDLQTEDSDSNAFVYRPAINLAYLGQRNRSEVTFGANYNKFSNAAFQDNTNFNFNWDQQRIGVNSILGLNLDFSERLIEQLVELDDRLDVSSSDKVRVFSLNPNYSVSISPTTAIGMSYIYSVTDTDTEILARNENTRHDVSANWQRTISPNSTFLIGANYVAFRREGLESQPRIADNTDVYGMTIGGQYQFTNKWLFDGSLGASVVSLGNAALSGVEESDTAVVADGDVLPTGNAVVTYTGQRDTVSFILGAGATQQLDGSIDSQQSFGGRWTRQLTDSIGVDLFGRYFHAKRNDRDNYEAGLSLAWQASTQWRYFVSYGFRKQSVFPNEETLFQSTVDSNRITLTLDYSFEEMRFGI